jgi:serine/threonine protein kinase
MHQKGYLQCDLKSNNVLISKNKGYDFGKVLKITHSSSKKYKEVFSHIDQRYFKALLRPQPVMYNLLEKA